MENLLIAKNITKDFTGHRALENVSISVPRGKVYGLLGPNGAGKTTLIRIINHITAPDFGTVEFDGHLLTAADTAQIGYLPEERGLYKKMKVGDQALFFARLKGLSKADATRQLKQWFDHLEISDWWDKKVEELSKGMAQKVQFIVTVLHRPKLLIFDEPFSGFDPINAALLKREILNLRDQGSTVIFSTHNMSSVEELCENITLINRGHNILSGPVAEIREKFSDNSYDLAYIGSPQKMAEAAAATGARILAQGLDSMGNASATIALPSSDSVREVLGRLNSDIEIRSFSPRIASMDDIFVRAVEHSNQTIQH